MSTYLSCQTTSLLVQLSALDMVQNRLAGTLPEAWSNINSAVSFFPTLCFYWLTMLPSMCHPSKLLQAQLCTMVKNEMVVCCLWPTPAWWLNPVNTCVAQPGDNQVFRISQSKCTTFERVQQHFFDQGDLLKLIYKLFQARLHNIPLTLPNKVYQGPWSFKLLDMYMVVTVPPTRGKFLFGLAHFGVVFLSQGVAAVGHSLGGPIKQQPYGDFAKLMG